jgi:hypothetical protein
MPEMKLASQTPGGASVAKTVGHELRQVALITHFLQVRGPSWARHQLPPSHSRSRPKARSVTRHTADQGRE